VPREIGKYLRNLSLFLASAAAFCDGQNSTSFSGQTPPPPLSTVGEHWTLFVQETFSPLSAGGTVFNAAFSQLTNSDPRYGRNRTAFAERVGASAADIVTQNFFGDFVVASAFHEDPRYIRLGEEHGLWHRVGYAISRAAVIRTSSGGSSFNWDNFLGSAMSAGFSNLYYPPGSRTGGAMLIHFGTSVADNGFVNLAPEFWPDFRRKVLHRQH
jgi:ABC-type transport system substrate-binding protein